MTTFSWKGGSNGNWNATSRWSPAGIPNATNADAVIAAPGTYSVLISANTKYTVESITLNATAASLRVAGTLNLGTLALNTGTLALLATGRISGGIIDVAGGTFVASGGTLEDVGFRGTLDLSASDARLVVQSGINGSGPGGVGPGQINLTGANASLACQFNSTIGEISVSIGGSLGTVASIVAPLSDDLTIGIASTLAHASGGYGGVRGFSTLYNQGLITAADTGGFSLSVSAGKLVNQGTIAVASGDRLDLSRCFALDNSGTITVTTGGTLALNSLPLSGVSVTNGTLEIAGFTTPSTAQLSSVAFAAATLRIVAALDNAGGTLTVGGNNPIQRLDLSDGRVTGGTVIATGASVTSFNGTLEALAFRGGLDLSAENASITFRDGVALSNAAGTGKAAVKLSGSNAYLNILGGQTLDNAVITMGGSGNYYSTIQLYDTGVSGQTLTFGGGLRLQLGSGVGRLIGTYDDTSVIVNKGTIIGAVSGTLNVVLGTFQNENVVQISNGSQFIIKSTFVNLGSVVVSSRATLAVGTLQNTGSISVNDATLSVQTGMTTAQLATITFSISSVVAIDGTLDNSGATLTIGTSTSLGAVVLRGAISGGVVVAAGTALAPSVRGYGTLDSVAYRGVLNVQGGSQITVVGTTTFATADGLGPGLVTISGSGSGLVLAGGVTIDNAALVFVGQNFSSAYIFIGNGSNQTVTIGAGASIKSSGYSAYVYNGSQNDALINQGTIVVGGGGILNFYVSQLTNDGTILLQDNGNTYLGSTLTNISGGTLSGGFWRVGAGSVLSLANNVVISTLNADVSLSGYIYSYNTGLNTNLELNDMLETISSAGILRIQGFRDFFATHAITDNGQIGLFGREFNAPSLTISATGTFIGSGTLNAATANAGLVEASGNLLYLSKPNTGTGKYQIDSYATLELASAASLGSNTVVFAGSGATLRQDVGFSVLAAMTNFGAGSAIQLAGVTGATAAIVGTNQLDITPTGGGTLSYLSSQSIANLGVAVTQSSVGTTVSLIRSASGVLSAGTLSFGVVHVGDAAAKFLLVTNSALVDGYSENLDARYFNLPAGFTGAGKIDNVAAGDRGKFKFTLNTAAAGKFSGKATVKLWSDGTGIDNRGTTALPNQTLSLSGTVNNYATSSLAKNAGIGTFSGANNQFTLSFGTLAFNAATNSATLLLSNIAVGPADLMSGTFTISNVSGAFVNTGFTAFSGLGPDAAQSGTALTIQLKTNTSGTFSETITINPVGSNSSGYSASLGAQTLTVTGVVGPKLTQTLPFVNGTDSPRVPLPVAPFAAARASAPLDASADLRFAPAAFVSQGGGIAGGWDTTATGGVGSLSAGSGDQASWADFQAIAGNTDAAWTGGQWPTPGAAGAGDNAAGRAAPFLAGANLPGLPGSGSILAMPLPH